jgi:hypothetical protein
LVGLAGCDVRLCGPCALVRPRVARVCPVTCVSRRLPPVSYRYNVECTCLGLKARPELIALTGTITGFSGEDRFGVHMPGRRPTPHFCRILVAYKALCIVH